MSVYVHVCCRTKLFFFDLQNVPSVTPLKVSYYTMHTVSKVLFPQTAFRVCKYAKFGVFYAKIVQMTPWRLRRESLRLQKFSVTNREPLRLQKFAVTSTVLSLPFSHQIQFTLIVNVVNLN